MNYRERDLVMNPLLKKMEFDSSVLWVRRTASFRIGHVTVGKAGDWDITAIVKCQSGICLLFIECKQPSKKVWAISDLPYEQRQFHSRHKVHKNVYFAIINDVKQYKDVMKEVREI